MAKIRLKQDALKNIKGDQEVPEHVAVALVQAGYAERLDDKGNPMPSPDPNTTSVRMRLKRSLAAGDVIEVSQELAGVLESSGLAAHPNVGDTNATAPSMRPKARLGLPDDGTDNDVVTDAVSATDTSKAAATNRSVETNTNTSRAGTSSASTSKKST